MKLIAYLILFIPFLSFSQTQSLKFSSFIDTYYAYDSNHPHNDERDYTTQPKRHNEPNINLIYADTNLNQKNVHGRLAIQGGSSVEKNTKGTVDEKNWAKYLQEAYLGFKHGDRTWIDAGIFLGHIGGESWISKDNWTYTRALSSEYTPYYASGLRITHELSDKDSFQVQILNGWQNINETNESKSFGMQYKRVISDQITLTYNNFFGDERVNSPKDRFRGYHNFILLLNQGPLWQYLATFDFGHQSQVKNDGIDAWYSINLTGRRILSEVDAVAFRGEYYSDSHQSNVVTGTKNGFNVLGASTNYDRKLNEYTLWRNEIRGLYSRDKIYPHGDKTYGLWDAFFITSLAVSI